MPDYPSLHRGPEHGPAGMSEPRLSVAELLHREGRIEEPMVSGRSGTYRVLALAAGIVLVGAVVVASTAALAGPRVERALPATGVLEHITGAGVLRPDLINTAIGPAPTEQSSRSAPETGNGSAAPAETTGAPPPGGRSLPSDDATATDEGAAGSGTAADEAAPSAEPSGAEASTGEPADPTTEPEPDRLLRTVRSFYQQVVTDPADAYAMLGPGMRGTGYRAFAESWRDVERVTVDSIRSDGPDAAIVAVVVERVDGAVLRSVQRLVVDTSGSPRIESARLLSASTS